MSRDSYGGNAQNPLSLHRYIYCGDDPFNRVDPSGHEFSLGGVMSAVSTAITLASHVWTCYDAYQFFKNPTVAGAVGLAVQFVPGERVIGGVSKLVAKIAGRGASAVGPLRQIVEKMVEGYFGADSLHFIFKRAGANYRQIFFESTRLSEVYRGAKVIVHHAIPQKYVERGLIPACLVHNLGNLRAVPKSVHELINHEWIKFEELTRKELGRLPTADEVVSFAKYIDEEFAARYVPTRGY